MRRFAVSIFLTTTVFGQAPPVAPQVFRATTDLVPVDIRVLDKNGKPVTGLTASDFSILEDGVPQTIRHFSAEMLARLPPATTQATAAESPAARAPTDAIPGQDHRVFLFVLGRGNLQRTGSGVDGVLHFVRERLLPQDLVAVLAWNRATEFTTDHARIADVLERFKRAHERVEASMALRQGGLAAVYGSKEVPRALQADIDAVFGLPHAQDVRSAQRDLGPNRARLNKDANDTRDPLLDAVATVGPADALAAWDALEGFLSANVQTMQDLGKLYTGVQYLRPLDGEKHLVFVSAAGFSVGRLEDDQDIAAAASDARVVIDYFHTAGTSLSSAQSEFGTNQRPGAPSPRFSPGTSPPTPAILNDVGSWPIANAEAMTKMTGGAFFVHQFRNVAMGMDRLDDATRTGYVLGYYPANPKMDGRYRRIQVIVNRPGATVQYRHGYFARAQPAQTDLKRLLTYTRIAAAAEYGPSIPDIKVDAKASLTKGDGATRNVQLEITIDVTRLTLVKREGLTVGSIDVATFLLDDHDRTLGQVWQTVGVSLTDDRLEAVKHDGARVRLAVALKGVPKRAKVVVYDAGADLVGSATVDVR